MITTILALIGAVYAAYLATKFCIWFDEGE